MRQQNKSVIVMDPSPQVLKGLTLLLADMRLNTIPVHNQDEIEHSLDTLTDCPDLLLLPFELNNGQSGLELVAHLRAVFAHHIPAILIRHENGYAPDRFIAEDIVVLSDRIKPNELRRIISSIVAKPSTSLSTIENT